MHNFYKTTVKIKDRVMYKRLLAELVAREETFQGWLDKQIRDQVRTFINEK